MREPLDICEDIDQLSMSAEGGVLPPMNKTIDLLRESAETIRVLQAELKLIEDKKDPYYEAKRRGYYFGDDDDALSYKEQERTT